MTITEVLDRQKRKVIDSYGGIHIVTKTSTDYNTRPFTHYLDVTIFQYSPFVSKHYRKEEKIPIASITPFYQPLTDEQIKELKEGDILEYIDQKNSFYFGRYFIFKALSSWDDYIKCVALHQADGYYHLFKKEHLEKVNV